MSETKKHTTSNKRRDLMSFAMLLLIVCLLNFVGSYFFKRFDLTSEKRYTLASSTINLLEKLDDVVYLKIYLQGELNPGFTRLRDETKEMLDEFRAYSNKQIEYEFIDPNENPNKEEVEKIERQLYEKGIIPEEVIDRKNQKTSKTRLWPGALVSYKGHETSWQIYKGQMGIPREQSLNNSVKELEYGLTNTVRKIMAKRKTEVTFIEGHGELDTLLQYDFMRALGEYYTVTRTAIDHKLNALNGSAAIVIAQPDSAFDEKDKFIIDQFIMRGGKVLWLLDPVQINMDTFRLKGFTLGFGFDNNLGDMLFNYGVRLNPALLQDLQCASKLINMGFKSGQPNLQLFPWIYSPLIMADGDHPIVKNVGLVKTEFLSNLDTVSAKGIKKTILLKSSRYTKIQTTPARIALKIVTIPPKESQFRNSFQPCAVLLEGAFESNYKNRLVTAMYDSVFKFKELGVPTKMIVVADGDISKNDFQMQSGMVYPLGYDKDMRETFANKTFLLNCMNYLLDDEGLLQLRAREIKLRLLDKKKISTQQSKWQMINVGVPLGIVILFGLIQFYLRKRKYGS